MSGTQIFRLPDVGEGLTEGEVVSWHVEPGETVALNDVLLEIETAKAVVELPSPFTGVVVELLAAVGDVVPVGAPLIRIESGEHADPPTNGGERGGRADSEEPPHREPVLVGYGPSHGTGRRRPRREATTRSVLAAPASSTSAGLKTVKVQVSGARVPAAPQVRKLARELGVDLGTVVPTSPSGIVTRKDLLTHSASSVSSQAPALMPNVNGSVTRVPVRGVRKVTADAVVSSAFTAPHVTEWVDVDLTRTLRLLDRTKDMPAFAGRRLTPLVFVMRAALLAIRASPQINSKWDEAAQEIVQFTEVNLGIAAATPRGLTVPNIAGAQRLSFLELAEALRTLVGQAREGKTPLECMRGGTFTITNIGVFGVDGGTPILNPGEAAILCLGRVVKRPWDHKGKVRLREVSTLSLSFDHRLIDGDLGSRFLRDVANLLERPDLALLA